MLWDLTYRIVTFWSGADVCPGLWEGSQAVENAVQLCGKHCAVFLKHWFLEVHNHKPFHLSYLSLV